MRNRMVRRIYDGRIFVPDGPTAFTQAADGLEVREVGIVDPFLITGNIPDWLKANPDYITWRNIIMNSAPPPAAPPVYVTPPAAPPVYVTPPQAPPIYVTPPPPPVYYPYPPSVPIVPTFPWGRWGIGPFSGPFGLGGRGGFFGGGFGAGFGFGGRRGGRGPYVNIV